MSDRLVAVKVVVVQVPRPTLVNAQHDFGGGGVVDVAASVALKRGLRNRSARKLALRPAGLARVRAVNGSLASRVKRLSALPTRTQANTVAVDPRTGRVFVAYAGANAVQIIDPRR